MTGAEVGLKTGNGSSDSKDGSFQGWINFQMFPNYIFLENTILRISVQFLI